MVKPEKKPSKKKQNRPVWLFVCLGLIAGFLIILKLTKPNDLSNQQPPPPNLPVLKTPKLNGFSLPKKTELKLSEFISPGQAPVYQGEKIVFSENKAGEIAEKLGFSDSPQEIEDISAGKIYVWSQNNYFLTIFLKNSQIDFGLDLYRQNAAVKGQLPTFSQAKEKMEKTLSDLEIGFQFQPKWQQEIYFNQNFYSITQSEPTEADLIRVGFNPGLDNFQLVGTNPQEPMVTLTLDKNNEIVRFKWLSPFKSFVKNEIYPLKKSSEIKQSLSEAKIMYTETMDEDFDFPDFTQVSFDRAYPAYFAEDDSSQFIQPIFVLEGEGFLSNGKTTKVYAYLPAISSKYLKKSPSKQDSQINQTPPLPFKLNF